MATSRRRLSGLFAPCRAFACLLALTAALWLPGCGNGDGNDADTSADTGPSLADDPWAGQQSGVTARYELQAGGWHDTPFPSELRRRDDGSLDLGGFPEPRTGKPDPLLLAYIDVGSKELDGWGIAPTIYVAFDGAPNADNLPRAAEAMDEGAMVQLIDVDPASPERGRRFPLRIDLSGFERGNLLLPHLLMAQPTWGAALLPKTSYALIVRRGLRDSLGRPLGQPAPLARALDAAFGLGETPSDATEAKLAGTLAPLAKAVQDGVITLLPRDLAAVAVFRTGAPAVQLATVASWLQAWPGYKAATDWTKSKDKPGYTLYTATYLAPNFQHGKPPYTAAGGNFVFDAAGKPVPYREDEPIRVAVAVPKLPPGEGLDVGGLHPVVLYSHGTGGSYTSFTSNGPHSPADLLTERGLVVVSVDQPLHGLRSGTTLGTETLYLASFNFLNPASGRTTFRQAALDNVALVEMIKRGLLEVPGSVTGGKPVGLDGNRLSFYGHSQGGLVGPLLASIEPTLRAFVLSGTGAGLSQTIVRRKDILNFPELVRSKLDLDDGELSEFHPAISLIQMMVETVDPIAYGRLVLQRPKGVRPPHIFHTEGLLDEATPAVASEALAVAMGIHLLEPVFQRNDAMKALKTPAVKAPVQNNVILGDQKITGVLRQAQNGSHYTIFDYANVANLAADFLASVASTGEAIVGNDGM